MRADGPVQDLTEAQKIMANIAGIPGDRPLLGSEYPKMVYRPGVNARHSLNGDPLKIAGKFECETALVDDPEDEAAALADGWFTSPDPEAQQEQVKKREAEQAKDRKIAELEAQLAQQKPSRETLKAPSNSGA